MSIETLLPDWTLISQTLIFWAVLFILHRFVFKPFGAVIEQRIAETEGLQQEAEKLREEASELQARYEERLDNTRAELHRELTEKKRSFDAHANEIISAAKSEANKMNEEVQMELAAKGEELQKALEKKLESFSEEICEKVLGRSLAS